MRALTFYLLYSAVVFLSQLQCGRLVMSVFLSLKCVIYLLTLWCLCTCLCMHDIVTTDICSWIVLLLREWSHYTLVKQCIIESHFITVDCGNSSGIMHQSCIHTREDRCCYWSYILFILYMAQMCVIHVHGFWYGPGMCFCVVSISGHFQMPTNSILSPICPQNITAFYNYLTKKLKSKWVNDEQCWHLCSDWIKNGQRFSGQKVLRWNLWKLRYCAYRNGRLAFFKVGCFSIYTLVAQCLLVLKHISNIIYEIASNCSVALCSVICT